MSIKNAEKVSIAENQKKLRNSFDFTVPQLGKKLQINPISLEKYETVHATPPVNKMIKISDFFGISIDFLLLWDQIKYTRSTKLLSLAEKIDKMDVDQWHKVEATASTFMGDEKANIKPEIVFDDNNLELTKNINLNIKTLRKKIGYTQEKLGRYLDQTASQISNYETGKSTPPADNLILLSVLFETSIHFLVTGKELYFHFNNKDLKDTILNADYFLDLKKKEFLCEMMEKIIEQN